MTPEATRAMQRTFLSAPFFAVVGASKDQSKYGTKVLKWYKARDYKVTPVHPREAALEELPTLASIADLPHPKETSLSIITPPKVTLSILEQAKQLSIPTLWLQPGAEDSSVIEYIRTHGLSNRVIYGGACILEEGDDIKKSMLNNLTAGQKDAAYTSAAWYAGWHSHDFPLSNIGWEKYTHLTYAFATTTPSPSLLSLGSSDEQLLPSFVTQAHQHGVKANLAIGGWTGSRWFSPNVGSPENRTLFVTTVSNLIKTYGLDGIDFDWEFPGSRGIGCNAFAVNDAENFLAFLQEFRQSSIGSSATISLAVSVKPYLDSSGAVADLSAFSQVVDYIEIMNYDIKSSPSVGAGPSSPLDDSCAPPGAQLGSAVSAVKAWTDAGIPADKIVLGVPAYGHSFAVAPSDAFTDSTSQTIAAYPHYNDQEKRAGDRWDGGWTTDICGNEQGPGGIYTYWGLIDEMILNKNGTVHEGISYQFDDCSQTPFAYDAASQTLVSFEDATSFGAKGRFIKTAGLKGFAMWEAGGDYHDSLLNALFSGLESDVSSGTGQTPSAMKTKASSRGRRLQVWSIELLGVLVLACVWW
ncbi:hypothetical protein AX17_004998 [Amanita inopinata Kibby_2008]|nr:hypothetical protein AX17_004998 [Amanita inopinata Kibby_2008]